MTVLFIKVGLDIQPTTPIFVRLDVVDYAESARELSKLLLLTSQSYEICVLKDTTMVPLVTYRDVTGCPVDQICEDLEAQRQAAAGLAEPKL